ncbi:hypothetical protein F5Y04DRAFT_2255 [Hypomontagnella monticulosa]|nr:hypothetical protein F5Y04DRAFT_2255 [Hypomontagnella monticulosa]
MDPMPNQPTSPGSGPLRTSEPGPKLISSFAPGNGPAEESVVDSPLSPASPNALARFEFEMGRGNEGSKILMVEWDPNPTGEDGWVVTWEGKATTFPVSEKVEDEDEEEKGAAEKQRRQRLYFLLPSSAPIPPVVTISHAGSGRALTAKSMPAIFAPGLGIGSRDAGRRGVLHTIWGRLRAGQLHDEIRAELRSNSESVGLEMTIQERLWIIDHFGLDDLRPLDTNINNAAAAAPASPFPQSPRSPIGGRLGEKLKGLKLATSPSDLANPIVSRFPQHNPHLPKPDPPPQGQGGEGAAGGGVASLDAVLGGQPAAAPPATQSKETEDELFALPMSPRSPDMKGKSPFSLLR